MFLKGNIISLRAMEPADGDVLYKWENDRDLWPYSFTQIPFSRFVLDEFVNASHQDIYINRQLRLMIEKNGDHGPVGIVDLFEFEPQHNRCGIGIYVHENHRLTGCASECVELIKEYCFQTLLLKQVYAHVNALNLPSLALFEKTGFEKSGLKKSWSKTGLNTYEDVWFLQCINKGD